MLKANARDAPSSPVGPAGARAGLRVRVKRGGWGTCLSPGLYPTPNSRLIAAVSYSPTTPRSQYHQRKGGLASGFGKEPGVSRLP